MKRYELIIIGAGPAGLSAAIEAAKAGMEVVVFDENAKPGGQLFKQIHKFFGSKEHRAKIRGFNIGKELLEEAEKAGVKVVLNATVIGIYPGKEITVVIDEAICHYRGDYLLVATGASENMVPFPGWTLPGVIGAGAAQTMMNLHGIKPGHRVLMLGTGNVGLVVGYQLQQAGCELVAMVDAAKRVGGYGVHAAKVARSGVPYYLSHTIIEAKGQDKVAEVTIGEVDASWKIIPGTEKTFTVDTICLAVGLSPMSQLLKVAGCRMADDPSKGGVVPTVNRYGETTIQGIYAAGDVSGIEEASSAMIEGRISGLAIACDGGYLGKEQFEDRFADLEGALKSLRQGMFAPQNRGRTDLLKTEEGILISQSLLKNGYIGEDEIDRYPGVKQEIEGIHPVIECSQNIPCNPCQDACQRGCISIGSNITGLPIVNGDKQCTGCGMCVASCSGQAIFLVEKIGEYANITIPYEFLPLPSVGDKGCARDRSGQVVCEAIVVKVRSSKAMDQTHLLTMQVPADMAMRARFFQSESIPEQEECI